MFVRLLTATLLLLAGVYQAPAQSCCPASGCGAKPASLPQDPTIDCDVPAGTARVGQVLIVGNRHTPQSVILEQVPFYPGQIISYADIREAEQNLLKLGIFEDGPCGVRPTVEVLNPDGPVPVKDILITVQEKCGAAFFCAKADNPKAKCSCDECKCCGCKNTDDSTQCSCEECKCCGCKVVKTAAKGRCGKCSACPIGCAGCCPTGFCPFNTCSMGWFVMQEICPALGLCSVCPYFEAKVQDVLKPCVQSFAKQCRQMFKSAKSTCPAEKDACEENAEPQAKKPGKRGCGQCGEAGKKVRVWEFRLCPVGGMKLATIRFIAKCGKETKADGDCCEESQPEAKPVCPYLQKKEKTAAAPTFEQLGSPLENFAKLEKARHLCKKAEWFCSQGEYAKAVQCYEKARDLCPGSRWQTTAEEGIRMTQAMQKMDAAVRAATKQLLEKLIDEVMHKSPPAQPVEEATQPAEESEAEPLPCQEPEAVREYKERFADLLEQARCACAAGDFEKARELAREASKLPNPETAEKVRALLDRARECYASGCKDEGWDLLMQAVALDPEGTEGEVQKFQEEMHFQQRENRCRRYDCDRYETLPPDDEDADPCEAPDGCEAAVPPCTGLVPHMPPVDPCLIAAMERVLLELYHSYDMVLPQAGCDGEEQGACFIIDTDEEDLELVRDDCVPCEEENDPDIMQQVRELFDLLRQQVCVDVDLGSSQKPCARLWVQIGNVEYFVTVDTQGQKFVRVKISAPEGEDIKAAQQANIDATLRWIESMNSGESATEGDAEETEEPYYQLETDLDPDW
jgi:tetratricopeptide (TPR) repeat protein